MSLARSEDETPFDAGEQRWPEIRLALSPRQRLMKRALDLVAATAALIVLSPLLIVVGLLVWLRSGSPVLFRQVRIGAERRPFVLYKFRTMINGGSDATQRILNAKEILEEDPEPQNGVHKFDDPRVTTIGRWLRRSSIDELPQLINVLRGEMSLVGPRPVLDWELELFEPSAHERFAVQPGITGRWQVNGRNLVTMRRMLEMDVEYVRQWSFFEDLSILVRTPAVAARGDGAR